MVQIRTHGGSCCGMRHIHGFGPRHGGPGGTQQNITDLRNILANNGTANANGLNLEVILSDRQTRDHPELIAELARLGFVYTTAWSGQHGTAVHLFHRAKRRLPLTAGIRSFNWTGMVASDVLSGSLPEYTEVDRNGPYRGIRVGMRVRVNSPTSRRHGREYVVQRTYMAIGPDMGIPDVPKIVMYDPAEGTTFSIIAENCEHAENAVYRHQGGGNGQAAPPAPQRILREYFALFADGRVRGPFETPTHVRQAYPRVQRVRRRDVYSNGNIENNDERLRNHP